MDAQGVSNAELLFLVADFLERGSNCSRAAAALRDELRERALLGQVTAWNGTQRPAEVRDVRGRFAEVAPNHLARLLGSALRASTRQRAELGMADDQVEDTEDSALVAQGSGAGRHARSAPSLLLSEKEPSAAARDKSARLIQCLDLARRYRRELSRLVSTGQAGPSAALQEGPADLGKDSSGGSFAGAAAADGASPSSPSADPSALQHYTGVVGKRAKELKWRIGSIEVDIKRLRSELRDFLVDRSRRSTGVLDLLATSQLGRRIERKLVGPTRELACARLRVMKKIYGHKAFVYCVNVDRTGRWIVTGSDDSLLKLWNARTGELCMTYRAHEKMICDLAIDKTSTYMVSCSVDETVRLWELKTGRHIAVLKAHTKSINVVEFDPAEGQIISAGDDGLCCIWDTERIVKEDEDAIERIVQGARRRPPASEGGPESAASGSSGTGGVEGGSGSTTGPSGDNLVSAEALAEAGITNAFLNPRVPIVLPHLNNFGDRPVEVNTMAVRPQGGLIVTACDDGAIRVWAVSRKFKIRDGAKRAPSRPNLVAGEYVDGAARLVSMLSGHLGSATMAFWSHKGDRLLTGSASDGTVRIWRWPQRDQDNDDEPDFFTSAHHRVLSVSGGANAATGFAGGSAGPGVGAPGNGAAGGGPGIARRAAASNSFKIPTLDNCTWSGDDSFVITTQSVKRRRHWDQTEYEDLVEFFDQRIKIFNSYTGHLVHNLCAHRKPAFLLRAHPSDNHLFLTGGHDGQICVWDVYSGKLLSKLQIASQYGALTVLDGMFAPAGSSATIVATDAGGRLIMIGTEDGSVLSGAYPEQFFANDYAELIRDAHGNVLDARTQLPPHLAARNKLVDSQGVEYAPQPLYGSRAASLAIQQRNLAERRDAVRKFELVLSRNEAAAMAKLKGRFRAVQVLIDAANEREQEEQRAQLAQAKQLGAAKRSGSLMSPRDGQIRSPRGAARGDGRGASVLGLVGRLGQLGARRTPPRTGDSSRRAGAQPLLACERATLAGAAIESSDSDSQGEEDYVEEGTRGRSTRAPRRQANEPAARGNSQQGRRLGRQAARRAQRHIRRFQEFEQSGVPDNVPPLSSSEEDPEDDAWDAGMEGGGRTLGAGADSDEDMDDLGLVEEGNASSDASSPGRSRRRQRARRSGASARRGRAAQQSAQPSRASQRRQQRPSRIEDFDLMDDEEDEEAFTLRMERESEEQAREQSERRSKSIDSRRQRSAEAAASRDKRSRNKSGRASSSAAVREEEDTVVCNADYRWLRETRAAAIGAPYVPQKGDRVVYCPQGHKAYLMEHPVNSSTPFQSRGWKRSWSAVLCTVTEISYEFPTTAGARVAGVHEDAVVANCKLSVSAGPSDALLLGVLPAPITSPNELWEPLPPIEERARGAGSDAVRSFSVAFRPHNGSEFLVLQELFEHGVMQALGEGDYVKAVFWDAVRSRTVFYDAKVTALFPHENDGDHAEWPGSPWECVQIEFDGSDASRVSPWELRRTRATDWKQQVTGPTQMTELEGSDLARRLSEYISANPGVADPFVEPVPVELFPSYLQTVPLPMDLKTVLERLDNGFYRHIEAVQADLDLIHSNCLLFNAPDSDIVAASSAVNAAVSEIISSAQSAAEVGGKRRRSASNGKGRATHPQNGDEHDESEEEEEDEEDEEGARQERAKGKRPARRSSAAEGEARASAPVSPRISEVRQTDLVRRLESAIAAVGKADRFNWFAAPVDADDCPDYQEKIAQPMDLATMQHKLRDRQYGLSGHGRTIGHAAIAETLRLFQVDLLLVLSNAVTYNKAHTQPYKAAKSLKPVVDKEMSKLAQGCLGEDHWEVPSLHAQPPSQSRPAAQPSGSRPSRGVRPSYADDEEEFQDEEEASDGDNDDMVGTKATRATRGRAATKKQAAAPRRGVSRGARSKASAAASAPSNRAPARRAAGRRSDRHVSYAESAALETEEEEEEEEDEDEASGFSKEADEDEEVVAARRPTRGAKRPARAPSRPANSRKRAKRAKDSEDEDSEDEDDEDGGEEDEYKPRPSRSRGGPQRRR